MKKLEINDPEELIKFFDVFSHNSMDFKRLDYSNVLHQYLSNDSLPIDGALSTKDFFLESKKGTCYDFSIFSCHILLNLGYKSDVLFFMWTPEINTDKGFVSCSHGVCRFVINDLWYVVSGFLYGYDIRILGPFLSLDDFINKFNVIIHRYVDSDIVIIDSWLFSSNDQYFPYYKEKLYPVKADKRLFKYY